MNIRVTWAPRLNQNFGNQWERWLLETSWFPCVTIVLQFVGTLEDSGGGFPISEQLPPAEQANARRAGWVIPMSTTLGPLGHTGFSTGVGRGLLAIPSAMKHPRESLEQSIFASNHCSQHSTGCSAVPGQAKSR